MPYFNKARISRNLSYEDVSEILAYDPLTGIFTWKVTRGNNAKAGEEAGSITSEGYLCIGITIAEKYVQYKGHMLAWLLHYKIWPDSKLDHRDRDRTNNRIKNLRKATGSQNQINRASSSKSGLKGVVRAGQKWRARIHVGRKGIHLGNYDTKEAAALAYNKAALEAYGEFAYLNRVPRRIPTCIKRYWKSLRSSSHG